MTTKFKCDSDLIETFSKSFAAAKEEAASCEAALAEAERIAASTPDDDGKKSPEQLYEREEKTRKNVFLRRVESKRASAEVAQIEAEFLEIANSDVTSITTALATKLQEIRTSLRSQLSHLVAEAGNPGQVALNEFVDSCDGIQSRERALRIIRMNHDGTAPNPTGTLKDLAMGLGLALKLI